MGTNYYLHTDFCPCCRKSKTQIHLGKSSMGWRFLFYKTDLVYDFESFKEFIKTGIIYDEYEQKISEGELLDLIKRKQKESPHDEGPGFYEVIKGYDFNPSEFR